MANRLQEGLEPKLRKTQYGFRPGRSTTEPVFIVRRMQELVEATRRQALHLIFLDWSKAFDKVDTRCLGDVLRRFGTPDKVVRIIEALVSRPKFKVSMDEEKSDQKEQGTGIRQGCTLSPFLFTLILSAIMEDVEREVRKEYPLATTPVMSVMDLEYADDTVLMARSAEVASLLLQETERQAGRYGLLLNRSKTGRIAYNTAENK